LALEYSEQSEAAIENVNLSISVLLKRLECLKRTYEGKGKTNESALPEASAKEIAELEVLLPEMEAKLRDLTDALEKEVEGGTIGQEEEAEEALPVVVNDISNLVKKSVAATVVPELKRKESEPAADAESKKAKLDN
jgi:hypothetical protein